MTIRKGVKWSDGKAMTPQDVKYSFDLAKIATHPQHPLWADTGLKSTKVSGNNVVFTFSSDPGLPAVRLLPLQRRGRSAARLQELQARPTSRPATSRTRRSSSAPGPYTYQSGVGAHVDDGRLEEAERLVGDARRSA